MTARSVVFGPMPMDFDDGFVRRRAAIPARAMQALGWNPVASGDADWNGAAAAVIDIALPGAAELAARADAAGLPWYADMARWLQFRPRGEPGSEEPALNLARSARRVIASSDSGQRAIRRAIPDVEVVVIPDPVETPASLCLAASHLRRPFRPAPLASEPEDLVVWWVEPEDDAARELDGMEQWVQVVGEVGLRFLALPAQGSGRPDWPDALAELGVWTLDGQFAQISRARGAFFPPEAAGPGLRRRVEKAMALGLAVIAPADRDLTPARGLILDDWRGGLARLGSGQLEDESALLAHSHVSATDVALSWDAMLCQSRPRKARGRSRTRILVFADLIQDVDLCIPLVRAGLARDDVDVRLAVTDWLAKNSPRVLGEAEKIGASAQIVGRADILAGESPRLADVDALITPAATGLNPHKVAAALVSRARAVGIPTFSLQHGLENVGLSYVDDRHSADVSITSDYVFVWFPPDFAPASSSMGRRKFVYVGAVKEACSEAPPGMQSFNRPVIAVFENLHWQRYDDAYRRRFVEDMLACAAALPDRMFLLKPHHAGRWAAKAAWSHAPENFRLVDPLDPEWEAYTAPYIIAAAQRVVTTPSTVALDAALAGKPVAVVGYGLDLPVYEPLPILRSGADWSAFINQDADAARVGDCSRAFLRRNVMRSSSADHVIDDIVRRSGAGASHVAA